MVGFAANEWNIPVLRSDANPAPVVPTFPLPSGIIFGENRFYPDRTDPTGELMKNEPIAPGKSVLSTDDKFLTYIITILSNPAADYHRRLDPTKHPGSLTDVAQFINQVDLNLTRDHHMICCSRNKAPAYVCNHKGSAPTVQDPTGYSLRRVKSTR